ncbi:MULTISPECIES: hemolysin family protein [Microbacterium]|uniref:Membrane protein n=1 Tax=Microbacterium testaceum TaxID=2033 RepID=A0A147F7Z3_MICTE|nr:MULTISPECIES: hemolysin family protein [Microbacterium]KTS03259.1 membrane protein [Microbacterium testaceum]KTS12280.1 membrane protein [Microbacterium testaceum]KTS69967.1 membrane protein [Microbacterium testaceum]MDQ1073940.1 CBS domain containing-hemolysin-like protein [Microbacterium sp. SORGH_AS_0969]MDQ1114169.1 CBS domain containing-hemolysin-like protein [Microbacterium testaceum]
MDYVMLGVGLLLTVGTGLFVASEFALVNLDRADLEARREAGESRLSLTIDALRITSTHLSSAQLGITLTTLLTGYTMEPAISNLLRPVFASWGLPEAVTVSVAAVIGVGFATVLSMILGELVPKNFALAIPRQTAKLVIPFQVAFTAVFKPAIVVLNGSANGVLRAMGVEPKEELSGARSAEELSSLVKRSASAGMLEKDTASLLDRSLTFARLSAADVMTPRPSVHALAAGDPTDDVVQLARRTGHSRFPVYGESMDDIVGVVHLKAAIGVPREKRGEVPVAALATEPLRVPETVHLDALVSELRSRGYQMAIVVDEYGGTAGIVTLEDLVEEIVGEVLDEHDRSRAGVVRTAVSLTFPGDLRPDEALDRAGVRVPEGDAYDTVGGFIMATLERIPAVGDTVDIEDGVLTVNRMDGRRVDRVQYTANPVEENIDDLVRAAKGGDQR